MYLLRKARRLHGSIDFNGLDCSIETGRSRIRSWHNPHDGSSGMSRMTLPYGYIRGTMGTDGDHVDVFVGQDRQAPEVYVVHTVKAPEFTEYDEDKCFLGLPSAEEAVKQFHAAYSEPKFFGSMSIWPFEEFKEAVYRMKGQKMESGNQYIPPTVEATGAISLQELRDAADRGIPLHKSGEALCKQVGDQLGVDWKQISLDEFADGMFEESEHDDVTGGDPIKTGQLVLAHLKEDKWYYTNLKTAKEVGILKSRAGIWY